MEGGPLDFSFAITFFGALFAIMNPVSNLPVFLSVTEGAPIDVQRRIFKRAQRIFGRVRLKNRIPSQPQGPRCKGPHRGLVFDQ